MSLDNLRPDGDIIQAEHENSYNAKRVFIVGGSSSRLRENLSGASGSGIDGDANRVFTLTTSNAVDIVEVFLEGVLLIETSQYTIDNSLKQVTIILNVWDSQTISIFYNV